MAKIYYDKDADLSTLKGKKVGIIGYGSQGRAHALNLRDSGLDVIVSELEGTSNYERAVKDNFKPVDAATLVKECDVFMMLVQDNVQPFVYKDFIEPNLKDGQAMGFAHGFSIHFNQIVPPENIDVYMVAPKGPGDLVREQFEQGQQDMTASTTSRTRAYRKDACSRMQFVYTFEA